MPEFATIAPWVQLGFAGAFAVYLLTRTIPRMEDRAERRDATFVAALEKRDSDASKAQAEERAAHREENHLLSQQQERQTERIIDAVNGLAAAVGGFDRNTGNGNGRTGRTG
jgi:hypothetical protein